MNVRDVVLEALEEAALSFRVKDGIVIVVDPDEPDRRWDFTVPLRHGERISPDDRIHATDGRWYRWDAEAEKFIEEGCL